MSIPLRQLPQWIRNHAVASRLAIRGAREGARARALREAQVVSPVRTGQYRAAHRPKGKTKALSAVFGIHNPKKYHPILNRGRVQRNGRWYGSTQAPKGVYPVVRNLVVRALPQIFNEAWQRASANFKLKG